MNKFTSLLCVLALALSVCAAPFRSPKPANCHSPRLEQRLRQAKTDKERLLLVRRYRHTAVQTPAKRAKRDVTDVTITRVSMTYDGDSRSVFYGLHTDDFAPAFYFDIPLAEGARDVETGRTYHLQDMNADYCEWDDEDWNPHYYTEAVFTKTLGDAYDTHISATVKDTDGNEWNLRYDEAPVVLTGETIQVEVTRPMNTCEYLYSSNEWLLRARDNNWLVQLEFASGDDQSPAGEFGASDIVWSDTYIEFPTGEKDSYDEPEYKTVFAKDGRIRVSVSQDGRTDVSAWLIGEDGNVYDVTLFYALPQKESEAVLTASNLNVDTWALDLWGEMELYASDTEAGWACGLVLYPMDPDNYLTTYELGYLVSNNGYVSVDGEQFAVYSGEITLSYADNRYMLTGSVLAWNNVEYTLQFTSPEPEIQSLSFTGENLVIDVYDGAWQIAGFDDDHDNFLSIAVYADAVAGEYTESNMEAGYTYLAVGENIYLLASAQITVTYAEGGAHVSGALHMINQLDGYDHMEVAIDIKAHPYQPSVRNLNLVDFAFLYYEDGPDVYYEVITQDSLRNFAFDIYVERWNPDVQFGKTYSLGDMIASESYGVDIYENTYVRYTSVSFTKAAAEGGAVTLTITLNDERGNTWNLAYEGPDKEIESIMNVTLGQANPYIWDGGNGVEYEMVDEDNTLSCHLVFDLPGKEDVETNVDYTSDGKILLDYSYLSVFRHEYKITAATFYKEQEDETLSITATLVDERGYKFRLNYYDDGFRPSGDTIVLTIDEPLTVTYWPEYDEWALYVEDETTIVSISLEGDDELNVLGDVTRHVSLWNSHIELVTDAASQTWDYIQLYSAESVVVSGTEGNYAMQATLIAENGITYLISVNKQPEAIESTNDQMRKCENAKILRNGMLLIEKDGKLYNITGAQVK